MSLSQINPGQLRPSDDDGLGPVIQVGPDRRVEAIERLVSPGAQLNREHGRRFLDYAKAYNINLEGLWARLSPDNRVEAAVLAVPSPGRTAMVFCSRPRSQESIQSVAGLIDHACLGLQGRHVSLAQVLLEPAHALEREAYRAAGFVDLAVLSYLERPLRMGRASQPPVPRWPAGAATVRFDDSMNGVLLAVLDQTYEETLDCPGLRGYRRTQDILEGHRASGSFDPALWTILHIDGVASGALLLNPSVDHQSIELVYLGLIKSARGRGLGAALLRHGLALVFNRSEQTMHLAVDEANAPALALYRREGFRLAMRRTALIRSLPAAEATATSA